MGLGGEKLFLSFSTPKIHFESLSFSIVRTITTVQSTPLPAWITALTSKQVLPFSASSSVSSLHLTRSLERFIFYLSIYFYHLPCTHHISIAKDRKTQFK